MTPVNPTATLRVLAAGAHPDDIEFFMVGTLLLLKAAGAEIHMWNVADGDCGTTVHDRDTIARIRASESEASAKLAGAILHPSIAHDLTIQHEPALIAQTVSLVRQIRPQILLVPSPEDYMEDHQNAARLLVTGAFARGAPNYVGDPPVPAWDGPVAIYHAMPAGMRNMLRRLIRSGQYVDIGSVLEQKRKLLGCHASQREWLDVSQWMDFYIDEMVGLCHQCGELSGRFEYAEGWRRHLHYGYGPEDYDPLKDVLGDLCWTDPEYEKSLG